MSSDRVPLMTPNGKKETGALFKISAPTLSTVAVILPSAAFFSCILISLIYDFEESTATHCKVCIYLYLSYKLQLIYVFKYNVICILYILIFINLL